MEVASSRLHSITFQKTIIWVVSVFTEIIVRSLKYFYFSLTINSYLFFFFLYIYKVLVAVTMENTVIWVVTLQIRQSLIFGKNVVTSIFMVKD
jgi:hypothetical protein